MRKRVRVEGKDLNYLGILQTPIFWGVQKWAERPENLAWVPGLPSWWFPLSLGLAAATLYYDVAYNRDSRIRQFFGWAFNSFEVKGVDVGHFGEYDGFPMTPASDVDVRVRVRFLRGGVFKCWLRIYECTGMGREPLHERILPVAERHFIKGEELWVPIVNIGIAQPGWDHTLDRGWGPERKHRMMGDSCNVAILECKGRFFTQKHKVFIGMIKHDFNQQNTPSLYVIDQDDDIWDTSANSELERFQ